MPRLRVESTIGPAKREIYKQLGAFNKRACGNDYQPLAITLRQGDEIVGGLIGETYWGWLHINSLWIAENQRRKNLGKALIEKAEAEARKRGVRNVFLDSFTFQAPKFYMKLGYREFGRLKEFPVGHERIWLTKAL
jgi:ribosomal protein S18 acetylase RimI-like enzyme